MIRPEGAHAATHNGRTTDESTNWSGYAATGANGDNSATWNPQIQVSVPATAVIGTYTATITNSVS